MMTYELDDVERRVLEGGSKTQESAGDNNGAIDPGVELRTVTAIKQDQRVASLTAIRAAIFDTIDAGCHHPDGMSHEWKFNALEESFANEQRCAFVDRVTERVVELQSPPHLFDEAVLQKLRDTRAEYRRGYSDGWEDGVKDGEDDADLRAAGHVRCE